MTQSRYYLHSRECGNHSSGTDSMNSTKLRMQWTHGFGRASTPRFGPPGVRALMTPLNCGGGAFSRRTTASRPQSHYLGGIWWSCGTLNLTRKLPLISPSPGFQAWMELTQPRNFVRRGVLHSKIDCPRAARSPLRRVVVLRCRHEFVVEDSLPIDVDQADIQPALTPRSVVGCSLRRLSRHQCRLRRSGVTVFASAPW